MSCYACGVFSQDGEERERDHVVFSGWGVVFFFVYWPALHVWVLVYWPTLHKTVLWFM